MNFGQKKGGGGEYAKFRGPEARARLRPEIFLAQPHSGPEHSGQLADPLPTLFLIYSGIMQIFFFT